MKQLKKLFLPTAAGLIALFISSTANAQFQKGTLMLGTTIGTTAYSSANSDYAYDDGSARSTGTHTYTFGIGPQVGVFLSSNLVLGATLSYNLSNSTVKTTNTATNNTLSGTKTTTTTNTVSLGPFLRYYLSSLPSRNLFYLQINGAAGTGTGNSSGNGYTTTSTNTTAGKVSNIFNWNTGGSVGLTHFFDKHIGMDISLGYNYAHAHSDNVNTTNTVKAPATTTSTDNDYTLNTGTNGVTAAVGFHWFLFH